MDHQHNYQLIRSRKRRKTISLRIKEDGGIWIYAPQYTPKWEIEKFFHEKQWWVNEKLSKNEELTKETKKLFIQGEKFLYLGEGYPLDVQKSDHGNSPLKLSFGKFVLDKDRLEEVKDLFIEWYKREAKQTIAERVEHYSHQLHLFPKEVRITSAQYRWGSCSNDDRLFFSWRMIMAPLNIIDYILIHELVHIKEKNHSRKFWDDLAFILPDYKERKCWLKKNGHSLRLS